MDSGTFHNTSGIVFVGTSKTGVYPQVFPSPSGTSVSSANQRAGPGGGCTEPRGAHGAVPENAVRSCGRKAVY